MKHTLIIFISVFIITSLGCKENDLVYSAAQNRDFYPLIDVIDNDSLVETNDYQQIPQFIRSFLDSLDDNYPAGKFSIANPGQEWQVGCSQPTIIDFTSGKKMIDSVTGEQYIGYSIKDTIVPHKLLNYFGIGDNTALMKFSVGGIARFEEIFLFMVNENRVTGFWHLGGGYLKSSASKQDILRFLRKNSEDWNNSEFKSMYQ